MVHFSAEKNIRDLIEAVHAVADIESVSALLAAGSQKLLILQQSGGIDSRFPAGINQGDLISHGLGNNGADNRIMGAA